VFNKKEYMAKYRKENRDKILATRRKYSKKYYAKNRDRIAILHKVWGKTYRLKNKEKIAAYMNSYWHSTHKAKRIKANAAIKRCVMEHYGGGAAQCAHCNINDIDVLTIDHIHNNGAEERKKGPAGGISFYVLLRKNNFPPGYQVLCLNCNLKKEILRRRSD